MLTAKLKKWGNSYGILIPKDEVTKMDLNEGQEVFIEIIKKENPLKDLFGFSKKNLKSTNQIIKEARDELRVD